MNNLTTEFIECLCPICRTESDSDSGYSSRAFIDPHSCLSTAESLSDSLGFCSKHAEILLAQDHLSEKVAMVILAAIARLEPVFNERFRREPQIQQLLFGADHACPACSNSNRYVGRHVARLARKFGGSSEPDRHSGFSTCCVRHFQMVAENLEPEHRRDTLTRYIYRLSDIARKIIKPRRQAIDDNAWFSQDAATNLNHALRILGCNRSGSVALHASLVDALIQYQSFDEAISSPAICPICLEAERGRQRWLRNVLAAANFNQDTWLYFPICPTHMGMVFEIGNPELTAAVSSHALAIRLKFLRQQIRLLIQTDELKDEEARLKAEGFEVWAAHKRKQALQKVKSQKTPLPRLERCPGCEWIEITSEWAENRLLNMLEIKRNRNLFAAGYGLCMKHFARVYRIAPKGIIRSMLSEDQQSKLTKLSLSLMEVVPEMSERQPNQPNSTAWKAALHRFSDFM